MVFSSYLHYGGLLEQKKKMLEWCILLYCFLTGRVVGYTVKTLFLVFSKSTFDFFLSTEITKECVCVFSFMNRDDLLLVTMLCLLVLGPYQSNYASIVTDKKKEISVAQ